MPEDMAGVTVNVYDVTALFAPPGGPVHDEDCIGESVIAWAEVDAGYAPREEFGPAVYVPGEDDPIGRRVALGGVPAGGRVVTAADVYTVEACLPPSIWAAVDARFVLRWAVLSAGYVCPVDPPPNDPTVAYIPGAETQEEAARRLVAEWRLAGCPRP